MSDETLRDLERRFRATGTPDDEARWLAERRRAGALDPARLELAAYVGHAPARVALGSTPTADDAATTRWRAALDDAGRLALAQATIAALRGRFSDVPSPRADLAQALHLLEAWAVCPCERHTAGPFTQEPWLGRRREAATTAGALEAAGFARRAQDAARAILSLGGMTFGYDPLEACLRDLRDAGPRAATLVSWALGGAP